MSNNFLAQDDLDEMTATVRRDGYVIIENALSTEKLAALKAELRPDVDNAPLGNEDFWGHKTKRFGALLRRSKIAQEMLTHPTVLGIADRILLPYCATYWVNYTGIMHLGPEETAQSLHRDTNLWPFANPSPPLTLATMWAVNDFTAQNGGTRLVPGSHLWEDSRSPQAHELVATEMPAGSVLVYTGNVIHGGGANRSDGVRFGLALHYVLGWLRQEENQVLTMSQDQARELPEQVQKLIGYSLGSSSLGMVDHRDPFEVLTGFKEDRPKALSTPALDAADAKMFRLAVVGTKNAQRSHFEVEE